MFWTAFVWGLGVSFGGSIGMMGFVVMITAWRLVAETEVAKRGTELAELANAALVRRNELTELQIKKLEEIARSAEFMCDLQKHK